MRTDLVSRARDGDREAFGLLAAMSVDRLYAIARLSLHDADLAEEAAQEALVRAWRDLPTLRDVERFEPWIYRLLVRSCADLGRARQRQRVEMASLPADPVTGDEAQRIADRDELERGLRRLRSEHRTVLVLRYFADLSVPEIADVMELRVGTVKSRLHYAMDALRAALQADARTPIASDEGRVA